MLFTVDKEDEEDEEDPAEYEEVVEEEADMVSAFANENMEEGTVPKVWLQHRCWWCNYVSRPFLFCVRLLDLIKSGPCIMKGNVVGNRCCKCNSYNIEIWCACCMYLYACVHYIWYMYVWRCYIQHVATARYFYTTWYIPKMLTLQYAENLQCMNGHIVSICIYSVYVYVHAGTYVFCISIYSLYIHKHSQTCILFLVVQHEMMNGFLLQD